MTFSKPRAAQLPSRDLSSNPSSKIANNAIFFVSIGWLADQISGEEQTGADLMCLQPTDCIVAGEWGLGADKNWEAEPAWS